MRLLPLVVLGCVATILWATPSPAAVKVEFAKPAGYVGFDAA